MRDRDVKANVQIIKKDAVSGLPVQDGEAAYVIHDVEGAWRKQYFAKATLAEKAAYLLRGDGLVLEYDQATGSWRGTRSNPYRTQRVQTDALAAFTKEGLPVGMQFIGNSFEEKKLIRMADAYQQMTDYHTRRPEIFGKGGAE